jgi:predicted ATPase
MSVVTFLFTDIEGSTRRWEADPDIMRVALETHNKVLREAVEANDGRDFNYTGDGMCAVFSSSRSAVDAAIAAQLELELPVRMGIATGEAELRGGDYFGTVLNRTARVMAAGHGGQILLDGTTAGLLSGADLISLGPRRLRDIAKPVEMFQVRAPGLRTGFPPLKTLDATPGNLRPAATTFIGRRSELTELEMALNAHRMVTLTGVGGVGKTRLALEVAARSANDFPDGVWVIELASVGDPATVPDAVAAVVGITRQPDMSLADSIAAALEGRSRLLVFDNCEHVLDAAADMIDAILNHSQTVKVLATSREGLRVAVEHLWAVPSLDLEDGIDSSAAALFVERAEAVSHGSPVNQTHDAQAVVEICRQLDGIPLGIDLAASRMQSMTATEVRDRLGDRFRLLVGSRRGLERHQTLRHAVQWSYDLLDDAERTLLNRCSVFAGGFDLAGAKAVTGSDDDFTTLDLLDALVRKSLLVADRSSAQRRFTMLETIRQFAEEQLVASGDADETRDAHARYFASREDDLLRLWDSPRQREAYEWFTTELPNLRAAFRWSADHADLDTATAVANYAGFLGGWVGQYEPIAWAEELTEPARAVEHRRLAQMCAMAAQCYVSGRVEDGLEDADAALAAIETGRFDKLPREFEASLGGAYVTAGQPDRWVGLCRSVIAREPASVFARACLVLALTLVGTAKEAVAAAQGLTAAAEAAGNPTVLSFALLASGNANRDVDPVIADGLLRRGLVIARNSGNRQNESHIGVILSQLAAIRGNAVDAFEFLAATIRNYYDSGGFSYMHSPLAILVALFDQLGRLEPAATISEFAATPFARTSWPPIDIAIPHLRELLGDQAYESLAIAGVNMTNAAMAAYALDQIDRARRDLANGEESS